MSYSPDDHADLTPDERRREVAAILARGALRLRRLAQLGPDSAANIASDARQKSLEVSATLCPHAV